MFSKGTIYNFKKGRASGEKRIAATPFAKFSFQLIRATTAGLISYFIVTVLLMYYPIIRGEIGYLLKKDRKVANNAGFVGTNITNKQESNQLQASEISLVQAEAALLGLDSSFSIYIPAIDAKSKIIANVDPGLEEEYNQTLSQGVAHAKGTFFPGQGKSIYLFAHSTNSAINVAVYNAVFYLVRKLEPGDEITVFFADKKYVYAVKEKLVAEADDTSWLVRGFGEETLILQTCYPPGTTWKRLLVVAQLKPGQEI